MVTKTRIIESMQFEYLQTLNPINTTGAPAEVITYQYAGTSAPGDLPTGAVYTGWANFTAAEKSAFEAALAHIETFLNVSFVEVTGEADPDMNVGKIDIPGSTAGYGGNSASWFGSDISTYDSFVVYDKTINFTSNMSLLLHELGHALGLKHPFEGSVTLPSNLDNNRNTLMSYTENPDNGRDSDAMQRFDIFATQDIWGAAANNPGNTVYTGGRNDTVDTVWDSGGKDTFNATGRGNSVRLDLREGNFSTFDSTRDVAIAYGTRIENAKGGAASDTLIGNATRNVLLGNGGGDTLLGKNGRDILRGGGGNDTIKGGNGNDAIKGGTGSDTLRGQKGNDTIFGNAGADTIIFSRNHDNDKVRGFDDNLDTLKVTGYGSKANVMSMASDIDGNVVFDFGNGDMITVFNISVSAIEDDVIV